MYFSRRCCFCTADMSVCAVTALVHWRNARYAVLKSYNASNSSPPSLSHNREGDPMYSAALLFAHIENRY